LGLFVVVVGAEDLFGAGLGGAGAIGVDVGGELSDVGQHDHTVVSDLYEAAVDCEAFWLPPLSTRRTGESASAPRNGA